METYRTFIAIDLPLEIRQNLAKVISSCRTLAPTGIKWVQASQVHITLIFLGDTNPKDIPALREILNRLIVKHPPFPLLLAGMGAFPSPARPRVLWVGLKAPETLRQLQHDLDEEIRTLGYALEDRPFSPHLTLGRVSPHAGPAELKQIQSIFANHPAVSIGDMMVGSISLIRSQLQSTGPIYSTLHKIELK